MDKKQLIVSISLHSFAKSDHQTTNQLKETKKKNKTAASYSSIYQLILRYRQYLKILNHLSS